MNKTIFMDKLPASDKVSCAPICFDLKKSADRLKIKQLFKKQNNIEVVDEFYEQEKELFLVRNPGCLLTGYKDEDFWRGADSLRGVWVFFPWNKVIVHCLDKNKFNKLRLARNLNLIEASEMKKYRNLKIGIAGLNVGNPGAVCLALSGVGNLFKLADIDVLSVSNLNRFRAGLCDLGVNKATLTARQIVEINPFLKFKVYDSGITEKNLNDFLLKPKLDVILEETDNLKLKIRIREEAKKNKIPVIMVTGNGENVIIDIERFDQSGDLPILNGYLPLNVQEKIKQGVRTTEEKIVLARDFMGSEHLHSRLVSSFAQVGKTLAGIPQLAESSFLRGAALCYFVRRVVDDNISSGRFHLRLSDIK